MFLFCFCLRRSSCETLGYSYSFSNRIISSGLWNLFLKAVVVDPFHQLHEIWNQVGETSKSTSVKVFLRWASLKRGTQGAPAPWDGPHWLNQEKGGSQASSAFVSSATRCVHVASCCQPSPPWWAVCQSVSQNNLDRCLVTAAGVNVCATEALQARESLSSLSLPGFDFAHEIGQRLTLQSPLRKNMNGNVSQRIHTDCILPKEYTLSLLLLLNWGTDLQCGCSTAYTYSTKMVPTPCPQQLGQWQKTYSGEWKQPHG